MEKWKNIGNSSGLAPWYLILFNRPGSGLFHLSIGPKIKFSLLFSGIACQNIYLCLTTIDGEIKKGLFCQAMNP